MHIDIVGGSGFIGTRLVQRLINLDDLSFKVIDKSLSKFFPEFTTLADVRSIDSLRSAISRESIIINLAAEHKDDVYPISLYHQVNIDGAENICTIASEKNINTIIFTSTVAVYGFAEIGTNENGLINPFNEYGRSKWIAEQIYCKWQAENPDVRTLVIVRPTVVFGERNRGNVYNLLKQIASGRFLMIGDGLNRKSMAYVENVAAFLQFSTDFKPGIHVYNYVDKPDFTMNNLVAYINNILGRSPNIKFRLPFIVGLIVGYCFDIFSKILFKKFLISAIRVKKFCANSVYDSSIKSTGFDPPIALLDAMHKTINFEFIESHNDDYFFDSE